MKTLKSLIVSAFAIAGICVLLPACNSVISDDTQTAIDNLNASLKTQIESGSFDADTLETQLKAVLVSIPADKRKTAESTIRAGVKLVCDYRVTQGAMTQADEDALLVKYDAAVVKVEAWITDTSTQAKAAKRK